jgi:hypothetical protein
MYQVEARNDDIEMKFRLAIRAVLFMSGCKKYTKLSPLILKGKNNENLVTTTESKLG